MKAHLDAREGIIIDFRIPTKIKIGECYDVSATYKGSVRSGFFSLMIEDRTGVKQWYKDSNSVGQKSLGSGELGQTGSINFSNGLYESKWKFRPDAPLYSGYAKAIVHMFEDTRVYPLAIQEKDVHLY